MKKVFILFVILVLALTGNAQKNVFQNLTWEQAAELAETRYGRGAETKR